MPHSLAKHLTIAIPSYQRPHDLARAAAYYAAFECPVVVYDGSPTPYTGPMTGALRYRHVPDLGFTQRLALAAAECSTPYLLMMPDDDLVSEAGARQAVAYLEEHPQAVSAHGQMIGVRQSAGQPAFMLLTGSVYLAHAERTPQDSPYDSLDHVLNPYHPIIWGVHRTETLRHFWQINTDWMTNLQWFEYFFTLYMAIQGQTRVLPIFFCARQLDNLRREVKGQPRRGFEGLRLQWDDPSHESLRALALLADLLHARHGTDRRIAELMLYGLLVAYMSKDFAGWLRRPHYAGGARARLRYRWLRWRDAWEARQNRYYVRSVDSFGFPYYDQKQRFPVYQPQYQADVRRMIDAYRQHPALEG